MCLSLLLAVALLAEGAYSPAVRHTHEGASGRIHRDDGPPIEQSHHELASGEDSFRQADRLISLGPALVNCTTHLHLNWLGLQFTLPETAPQSPGERDEEYRDPSLLFTLVARGARAACLSVAHADDVLAPDRQEASLEGMAGIARSSTCSPPQVTASRLCDRARHERSGVQLA
jgi:hypothetical protein